MGAFRCANRSGFAVERGLWGGVETVRAQPCGEGTRDRLRQGVVPSTRAGDGVPVGNRDGERKLAIMIGAVDRSPWLAGVSGEVTDEGSHRSASGAGRVSWRWSASATERAGARRSGAGLGAAVAISRPTVWDLWAVAHRHRCRRSRCGERLARCCTAGATAKPRRRRCGRHVARCSRIVDGCRGAPSVRRRRAAPSRRRRRGCGGAVAAASARRRHGVPRRDARAGHGGKMGGPLLAEARSGPCGRKAAVTPLRSCRRSARGCRAALPCLPDCR